MTLEVSRWKKISASASPPPRCKGERLFPWFETSHQSQKREENLINNQPKSVTRTQELMVNPIPVKLRLNHRNAQQAESGLYA
jgi:hypothetical protein